MDIFDHILSSRNKMNNSSMKLRLEVIRDKIELISAWVDEEEMYYSILAEIDDIINSLNKNVVNSLENKNDEEYLNLDGIK